MVVIDYSLFPKKLLSDHRQLEADKGQERGKRRAGSSEHKRIGINQNPPFSPSLNEPET
jgi:hypothetical protein